MCLVACLDTYVSRFCSIHYWPLIYSYLCCMLWCLEPFLIRHWGHLPCFLRRIWPMLFLKRISFCVKLFQWWFPPNNYLSIYCDYGFMFSHLPLCWWRYGSALLYLKIFALNCMVMKWHNMQRISRWMMPMSGCSEKGRSTIAMCQQLSNESIYPSSVVNWFCNAFSLFLRFPPPLSRRQNRVIRIGIIYENSRVRPHKYT